MGRTRGVPAQRPFPNPIFFHYVNAPYFLLPPGVQSISGSTSKGRSEILLSLSLLLLQLSNASLPHASLPVVTQVAPLKCGGALQSVSPWEQL